MISALALAQGSTSYGLALHLKSSHGKKGYFDLEWDACQSNPSRCRYNITTNFISRSINPRTVFGRASIHHGLEDMFESGSIAG